MRSCCKRVLRFLFNKCTIGRFIRHLIGLLVGLFVFAMGISCIALAVDRFDVAKKTSEALTPFSKTIPWVVAIAFLAYLIHLPDVLPRFLNFLDRIKSIGPVNLESVAPRSAEENNNLAEVVSSAVIDALRKHGVAPAPNDAKGPPNPPSDEPGAPTPETEVEKTLEKQARFKRWGQIAIRRRAEQVRGVPWEPVGRLRSSSRRFDGLFKRGDEVIVMEVKTARRAWSSRESLVESLVTWSGVKNALHNEGIRICSLDILFIADETFQRTKAFDDMVRRSVDILTDVHVFLYRFDQNDSTEGPEEIA